MNGGVTDVVLLSSQLWQSRFGGDPGIVGRRIRIGGEPLLVVGVMPPSSTIPSASGAVVSSGGP
jgi:hypothetical protein